MHLRSIISAAAILAGVGMATLAASAAVNFTGPTGWRHVDQPSTDSTRKIDQWKMSGDDTQSLTVMQDPTTTYADALERIRNNFSVNHFKPSIDKDEMCQGRQGHVVEFASGPDEHQTIWNRTIIPDGNGIVTITYTHAQGTNMDDDVKKAITAFCSATS